MTVHTVSRTAGQWALRGAVVAGIMVALLATGLRGAWPASALVTTVAAGVVLSRTGQGVG